VDPRIEEYRDLPHVSGEDIESGTGRLLPLHSAAEDGMTSGKYLFDAGVVLYSKIRPYLRKVAIANFRGLCSADMYPLTFDRSRVCLDFAKYALLSERFTAYAVEASARARMPKLNREQLLAYELPLPLVQEQERIAQELTATLATAEKVRRVSGERLAAAEALPAAYLREVFEGTQARIWPMLRLGKLVTKIGSGITPRGGQSVYVSDGVPLIRSQNVRLLRFDAKGLVFITPEQDEEMRLSRVQPGDVLLNITGASIGRVYVAPADRCPANVNQHVSIIRSITDRLSATFLAAFLASPRFQQFIWETQAGATRQALTKEIIEAFEVPVPPLKEQRQIATGLSSRLEGVESLVGHCLAEVETIMSLPAALLRSAFNGND
jgi:hypothetical protein